jgi:hypothetical protein
MEFDDMDELQEEEEEEEDEMGIKFDDEDDKEILGLTDDDAYQLDEYEDRGGRRL